MVQMHHYLVKAQMMKLLPKREFTRPFFLVYSPFTLFDNARNKETLEGCTMQAQVPQLCHLTVGLGSAAA